MSLSDTTYDELENILKDEVKDIAEESAYWYVTQLSIADCAKVLNGIITGDQTVLDDLPYVDWSGQWSDGPDWTETFGNAATSILGEDSDEANDVEDDMFSEVALSYGNEVTMEYVRKGCAERLGI
mgnify:CR=1 FL=1